MFASVLPRGAHALATSMFRDSGGIHLNVRPTIRSWIVAQYQPESAPEDHSSLLSGGTLNAHRIVELVVFLERCFGIEIAPSDLVPQHFDSVDLIGAFVQRKLREQGARGGQTG